MKITKKLGFSSILLCGFVLSTNVIAKTTTDFSCPPTYQGYKFKTVETVPYNHVPVAACIYEGTGFDLDNRRHHPFRGAWQNRGNGRWDCGVMTGGTAETCILKIEE